MSGRVRPLELHPGSVRTGHDLRNALMPLLLHLDLLDLHTSGPARVDAATITSIVENVQRLANGLLLRTTAPTDVGIAESVRLRQWWHEVGELVAAPLPVDCALSVRLPESLPAVRAEPSVLAHVLLHLIISVRLSLGALGTPRHVQIVGRRTTRGVSLSIRDGSDRAIPLRPDTASEFVEHWGLSLANSLLQRSGGTLSGYSSAARGTHVTLRLALAANAADTADVGVADDELPDVRTASQEQSTLFSMPREFVSAVDEPMRILIVDDNAALTGALALRFGLEDDIISLPPLHALQNSVAQIVAHAPTIVLLDLNLPRDERPIDVIRALQAVHPSPRVVVLTGNPSPEAVEVTRAAGASGFIAKGVSPDRLIASLRRVAAGEFVLALDG